MFEGPTCYLQRLDRWGDVIAGSSKKVVDCGFFETAWWHITSWEFWAVAVLFILVWTTFTVVRQKTAAVIEVFGKFYKVKQAGLRLKFPWPFAQVVGTMNLKLQQMEDKVSVKTSDNVFIDFPVAVQFRVIQSKAKEAFYELNDPDGQIRSYVLNVVRTQAAGITMDDLYTKKEEIANRVKAELEEKMSEYGFEIATVLVDEPQPSEEVQGAFNRVIAAQREKEAATNEAEAIRIRMVGKANAEAESLTLKAKAYAEQRRIIAEGIDGAMDKLRRGMQNVRDVEILDFLAGIDQRDTIRDASENPGTIIITPVGNSKGQDFIGLVVGVFEAINRYIQKTVDESKTGNETPPEE